MTAVKQEVDYVSTAAREALEKAGGDTHNAAVILQETVSKRGGLYKALMDPLLTQACRDAIGLVVRTHRKSVWKHRTDSSERVVALAAGNLLSLMDFPLPGGKRLGDASRSEVSTAAEFYDRQAKDMAHKGRWLALIAQSVTDEQTVGQALDENRLSELQTEARKDA